jgi:anti-sigma factor RsiW
MLDGELPDDDREWVDEHVRGCPACRDRLALIAAQGQALREVYRAKDADFSGFSDRVMARVAADKGRPPVSVWGSEMWQAHRGAFAAAGGLALAACMALAVLLTPPKTTPRDAVLLADATPPAAQIDEVDFGTHDGAVVQLPNQTTMIWMSEDRE